MRLGRTIGRKKAKIRPPQDPKFDLFFCRFLVKIKDLRFLFFMTALSKIYGPGFINFSIPTGQTVNHPFYEVLLPSIMRMTNKVINKDKWIAGFSLNLTPLLHTCYYSQKGDALLDLHFLNNSVQHFPPKKYLQKKQNELTKYKSLFLLYLVWER